MLYLLYVGFYVGVLYFYFGYFGYGIGYFMGYVFYKFKVEKGFKKGLVGIIERGKEGN